MSEIAESIAELQRQALHQQSVTARRGYLEMRIQQLRHRIQYARERDSGRIASIDSKRVEDSMLAEIASCQTELDTLSEEHAG